MVLTIVNNGKYDYSKDNLKFKIEYANVYNTTTYHIPVSSIIVFTKHVIYVTNNITSLIRTCFSLVKANKSTYLMKKAIITTFFLQNKVTVPFRKV